MSKMTTTTITLGTSTNEAILRKQKLISRYKENVSKEFDSLFKTDEEITIANIALEVSSRILLEFLKDEATYGR